MKKKSGLIASMLAIVLVSCGKGDQQQMQGQGSASLKVVEIPTRVVTSYDKFTTSIEGINNNDVRPKIQGYIQEVYVNEGQPVTRGQALFRLETNVLTQNASAAQSALQAAEAGVRAAQVEVNKLIPLVQKNIISEVQLETAKASLSQAQANQAQAKANYSGIVANIDYAIVRSPINGVVGTLPLKAGSLVGPSDPTPLTTVSDISNVYTYFSMNEKEYLQFLGKTEGTSVSEKLKNFPEITLELADGSTYPEKGKIQTVSGQIDSRTGTVQFKAIFPNAGRLLTNGNSGAILIPKVYVDAIVVPESATVEQQGLVHVYKIVNDTAISTVVKVLDRVDRMVVVTDGVKKGDKIVAEGVGFVRDKSAVNSIPTVFDSVVKIKPIFK